MELNEPVASSAGSASSGEEAKEKCKRIYIHGFRGDRTEEGMRAFETSVEEGRNGTGPGPNDVECLIHTGHVGISFDAPSPIYGFNPDTGDEPGWRVIENLKQRKATRSAPYPGKVTDDTGVFSAAAGRGLAIEMVELVFPESRFNEIRAAFENERAKSNHTYSFPGKGGDCNCAQWPRNLGIPIPEGSGKMVKYIDAMKSAESPQRLGDCEG